MKSREKLSPKFSLFCMLSSSIIRRWCTFLFSFMHVLFFCAILIMEQYDTRKINVLPLEINIISDKTFRMPPHVKISRTSLVLIKTLCKIIDKEYHGSLNK